MEWLVQVMDTWGPGGVLIIVLAVVIIGRIMDERQRQKTKDENQEMIRAVASSEAEERRKLQARLDSTEQSWQTKEQSWETERETMKGELERSLNREAEVQAKLNSVSKELEDVVTELKSVQKQVDELMRERELDKIEKKQILDEAAKVKEQNTNLKKDNASIIRERNALEMLIAEQADRIASIERRNADLDETAKLKDHQLSEAYGTISRLSTNLAKFTDETQEIPPFKDIENAGNSDEVVTPVLNMELNIEEAENTTIVTPAEESADNVNEDDIEDKKSA